MPEQKTEKTSSQHYEERIEQIQRSNKELVEMHAIRLEECKGQARDQEAELKAQADGLLGALGRVSAENADLKAKLQDVQNKADHSRLEMKAELFKVVGEAERLREDKKRLEIEVQREFERLHEELAAAKSKK